MTEKPIAALGIDPGQKGALVIISGDILGVHNFRDVESSEAAFLSLTKEYDVRFAILERVWFRPNERDVKSVEVLIRNHEMWHTLLHVFKIPHENYSPGQWRDGVIQKKDQGNKKIYIEKAKQLMPGHADRFTRHDIAEAALMAWRAWMHVSAGWKVAV